MSAWGLVSPSCTLKRLVWNSSASHAEDGAVSNNAVLARLQAWQRQNPQHTVVEWAPLPAQTWKAGFGEYLVAIHSEKSLRNCSAHALRQLLHALAGAQYPAQQHTLSDSLITATWRWVEQKQENILSWQKQVQKVYLPLNQVHKFSIIASFQGC